MFLLTPTMLGSLLAGVALWLMFWYGVNHVDSIPFLNQYLSRKMILDWIRKWYTAWVKKDFDTFNNLQADNFTFSSAAGDDHISKSTFKTQCWDTQAPLISSCDLERISTGADDAFVKYVGHTTNGKSFRNVEYFRIKNGKFESLECYFGAPSNFPSAVSAGQK